MAYTYNLTGTVRGGRRAVWDSEWDGSAAYAEQVAGIMGSAWYQSSMMFDTSSVAGKTITDVKLTFTVASGTIPSSGTQNLPICNKADSSTASWKRSSTTAVGYIANQTSGGGTITANNTPITISLGTTLPTYGYVAGPRASSYSSSYKYVKLASSATLAVTTNETYRTYTLTYDANGGKGAPSASSVGNIQVNPSCSFTVSSTKPTRDSVAAGSYTVSYSGAGSLSNSTAARTTSYTFSSWNTNSSGTGTNYASGSTFTSTSTSNTLYAKWSASTSTASVTLPNPTMTGYSFNGWWTANPGGTKVGNGGAAYTPTGNVTLYARWTPLKYRIDYNGNAGTGVSGVPEYQEQTHGVELTLRSGTPTRTSTNATSCAINYDGNGATNPSQASASRTISYTFVKWNTEQNGTGTAYSPGGKYSANKAATLWAQWSSTTTTSSVTLPTPSRSGYNFTGWYTAKTGGTKVGNAGASYNPGNTATSVTLYAQWSAANAFLSSFTNPAYCDGTSNNFTASWTPVGNCRYKITLTCGNASAVSSAVTAANVSSVSVTIPTTWYSMPNGPLKNSELATATCTLTTYENNGTTQLGTHSLSFTVRVPASVKPTLPTGALTAVSNEIISGWGTNVFVQGYSKVTLSMSVSDYHGSALKEAHFWGPGLDRTVSSLTSPESAIVTVSNNQTYYATCTDTRGRTSAEAQLTIKFNAYSAPTITGIVVERCNSDGTSNNSSGLYFHAKPSYSISSIKNTAGTEKNSITSQTIAYKLHTASVYNAAIACTSGTFYPTSTPWSAVTTSAYDVLVTVGDALNNGANASKLSTTLPSVQGIWYGKGNDRLGLGGVPAGPGLHVDWDAEFNGSITPNGPVNGNITLNGVLDVTPRRCYATLSSASWYRVLKIVGGRGGWSFSIDFDITRVYSNTNNEVHSIKLLETYNAVPLFTNEVSKTNALNVGAIRYTIDGNGVGYVDIRYDANSANTVVVDFTVHTAPAQQQYFTAESLQSVVESPNGETVLTTYEFTTNGIRTVTLTPAHSSVTINGQKAVRSGKVVSLWVDFTVSTSISGYDYLIYAPAFASNANALVYDAGNTVQTTVRLYADEGNYGLRCYGAFSAGRYVAFITYITTDV